MLQGGIFPGVSIYTVSIEQTEQYSQYIYIYVCFKDVKESESGRVYKIMGVINVGAVLLVAIWVLLESTVAKSISTRVTLKRKRMGLPTVERNEYNLANSVKQAPLLSAASEKLDERKLATSGSGVTKFFQFTGLFALWYTFNAGCKSLNRTDH